MSGAATEGVITIVGLALLTVATRGLFFLTQREIPLPDGLRQALRYAPLAALAAAAGEQFEALIESSGQLVEAEMPELGCRQLD